MSFTHYLRAQARRYGDTRWYAFVDDQGDELVEVERATFAELDAAARSAGAWLRRADMAGRTALLLYPAGLEFLRTFLGCLYSGAIAVPSPLPSTDPRALERAAGIIKDADVGLVLTDAANAPMLAAWLRESGLDGRVACVPTDATPLPAPDAWTMPDLGPDTTAYMQYTSGSTSEPRGVMLSHGNLLHNSAQIFTVIGRPDSGVGAGWLPHYHDMGLIGLLLQPLYAGGNLVFASPVSFVMKPVLWLRMISAYRAGYTVAPNFAYEWLARGVRDDQLAGLDLSSLTWALNGAEPVRTSTLDKVGRRFGPIGFRPEAWAPGYGMAEATLLVTGTEYGSGPRVGRFAAAALERGEAVPADASSAQDGDAGGHGGVELVGCGRPIDLTVRIVDPETAVPLPDGRVGEIWVSGGSVALGYWQRAESTDESFRARLAGGDGPYLRTGDLGFLHDGELFVTGRRKDVIIVNGRNLYPQDLEEAGREVHPAAGAAAAFGVEHGREHVVLVQEVRTQNLGDLTERDLARRIRGELARSFGLPSMNVVLVPRGGVGKTTSGKIQRRRMREAFLAGEISPLHAELEPEIRALTEK